MENTVVIGKILVPAASVEEFRKQSITGKFLKQLPGFVKGESYETLDASGNLTLVTIAHWSSAADFEHAQQALKEYYQSIKFNPTAYREKLHIVFESGVYSMTEY